MKVSVFDKKIESNYMDDGIDALSPPCNTAWLMMIY